MQWAVPNNIHINVCFGGRPTVCAAGGASRAGEEPGKCLQRGEGGGGGGGQGGGGVQRLQPVPDMRQASYTFIERAQLNSQYKGVAFCSMSLRSKLTILALKILPFNS